MVVLDNALLRRLIEGSEGMKPAPFEYVAPSTIAEACSMLAEAGGGATVLAGGQTLMPLLNLRMSQPFIIVDINKIAELTGREPVADGIRIGPMTRQCEVLADEALARDLPVLVQAMRHVGHHQTRNRGTVGGSIALGEPAAEMPATAVALGRDHRGALDRGTTRPCRPILSRPLYERAGSGRVGRPASPIPTGPKGHDTLFREVAQRPVTSRWSASSAHRRSTVARSLVPGSPGSAWDRRRSGRSAAEQMLLGRALDGIDPPDRRGTRHR